LIEQEAEPVLRFADEQVLPHAGRDGERRATVEIEAGVNILARIIDMQRPEPGDAAHLWIDGRLHESGCNRRIDRVAASLQRFQTRFDRFRLRR
jgi:hypothetical protein